MSTAAPSKNDVLQQKDAKPNLSCFFRSFPFGRKVLPNRFVMAPMTRGQSPGGVPTQKVAAYYRRRALGGVGLIISEGTYPDHPSANGYPDVPLFAGEGLEGWRRVIGAVHSAGGLMIPQLWHTGSYRRPGFDRGNTITRLAPSAVAHPGYGDDDLFKVIPKKMTDSDMQAVIQAYADSAWHAKELGFDGVEIHGAHGYLIDQFFWSLTNRRLDEYGGSIRERARFAAQVVEAVRKRVGDDFPIVFRFSNWKLAVYDDRGKIFWNRRQLQQLLEPLIEAGVDVFHASTRRLNTPEFEGSNLTLAGWTKKISGKPVIAVGSVGLTADFISERQGMAVEAADLTELAQRMENDEFDLVAIGRALLSDPAWIDKVRHGDFDLIVPYDRSCLSRLY